MIEIRPKADAHGSMYELTPAGRELWSVMLAIGLWAEKWLELAPAHASPAVVLWDWSTNYLRRDLLPKGRVLVRFEFTQLPGQGRRGWLLVEHGEAEICDKHPGFEEDLVVVVEDTVAFARWHLGQIEWGDALRSGAIRVSGNRDLARSLPTWNRHAGPFRRRPGPRPDGSWPIPGPHNSGTAPIIAGSGQVLTADARSMTGLAQCGTAPSTAGPDTSPAVCRTPTGSPRCGWRAGPAPGVDDRAQGAGLAAEGGAGEQPDAPVGAEQFADGLGLIVTQLVLGGRCVNLPGIQGWAARLHGYVEQPRFLVEGGAQRPPLPLGLLVRAAAILSAKLLGDLEHVGGSHAEQLRPADQVGDEVLRPGLELISGRAAWRDDIERRTLKVVVRAWPVRLLPTAPTARQPPHVLCHRLRRVVCDQPDGGPEGGAGRAPDRAGVRSPSSAPAPPRQRLPAREPAS
ncbi:MAG: hypothetical protein M3O70_03400 [Actinomycetota bacterium]|nr:hypothetical protein [Actinomycetota bacterium]